jgi:uncharacterized protein YjiS (DUF1127 family)
MERLREIHMRQFFADFRHRRQQRAALKRLENYDDHLLADIGMTRADLRLLRYGRGD